MFTIRKLSVFSSSTEGSSRARFASPFHPFTIGARALLSHERAGV